MEDRKSNSNDETENPVEAVKCIVESESINLESKKNELQEQIEKLEVTNRKMQNEFNTQRAKLREFYVQKEIELTKCQNEREALQRELDEMKSQFVVADLKCESEMRFKEKKAQEEISSLQQLVQDTIEESTICKAELERFKDENSRIWFENRELRDSLLQQQQAQDMSSIGPQVLSQVKKTIARKLAGESSGSALGGSFSQDTEDTTRVNGRGKQYENEDAEVLRSIVVQLQEEMKALKEKLREADEKLQTNHKKSVQEYNDENVIHKSTSIDILTRYDNCESCSIKIDEFHSIIKKDQEKLITLEKNLSESQDDLRKEAALRKVLEEQWHDKREAHKAEVQYLREQVKSNEEQLLNLQQTFLETKEETLREIQAVIDERGRVNKHLETLQADNDFLSGRYLETAEEIENQYINLPNKVDELQELILRQQNDLIQARVGGEYEKQKCVSSLDEIKILKYQLETSNIEKRAYKKKVQTEIKSLQDRLTEHLLTVQNYELEKTSLIRKEAELNKSISKFHVERIELQDTNEKLERRNTEYRAKIKILQDDLVTSEQVQKDFVKLSQTLQISLEKLRLADTEVRWQDDEDVNNCPSCNTKFTVTVRKIHCRHCGHIFCDKCLTKTVPSGPRKRIARVCDICHTLLTPNTAPYFSHNSMQLT